MVGTQQKQKILRRRGKNTEKPKGQITIPKEARDMFDIKEGDTIMVMGDKERGIALLKADLFYDIMEVNK